MIRLKHIIYEYFLNLRIEETNSKYLTVVIMMMGLFVLLWLVRFIIRKVVLSAVNNLARKTKTNFDDILISNKVPRKIASLIPLYIAYIIVPVIFEDFIPEKSITQKVVEVSGIVMFLWIIQSVINSLGDFLKTLKNFKDKPIESYEQVFVIVVWTIGILSIFVSITGIPFIKFLTTLGAASAVIIFVFKDTLLGFVASIQVSVNDMVRIGDWITFEKYGADGDVIEINLTTVKVQNFDLTITTIPTYALISDSFQNWRGMREAQGRRIKRAIYISQNSIKYLTNEEVEKLKKIQLISAYLDDRQRDISNYNETKNISKELLINGRNLTNVGVFRKWVDEYLKSHSGVNDNMMMMVRQLAPSEKGLPIEIYCFSNDKRWQNYEYIMADVFDHIIPAAKYFDLEIIEYPKVL